MVLAVLESRCGIRFSDKEVYLNIAGGIRINEPAADMAVAAALISALSNVSVNEQLVAFGELGLSGEIRPVARADARLKEAEKLGFTEAWVPHGTKAAKGIGLVIKSLETVGQLALYLESTNTQRKLTG